MNTVVNLPVDRNETRILKALETARIYKKHVLVHARQVVQGESVPTTMQSGLTETTNTANPGDWIVTNPSNESYVVLDKDFHNRYAATAQAGEYASKGYCRAIPNPYACAIELMAEWGALQYGDANCLLAASCTSDGKMTCEPYIIEGAAFAETYALAPVEK